VTSSDLLGQSTSTSGGGTIQGPLPGWGVPDSVSSTVADTLSQIWMRGTLSPRDRKLVTIAVLVALGVQEPLRLHVANSLNSDLSKDDIYELILQVGAYAGFARATDAFNVTKDVLAAQ
jgi:4-carboxymuconolactone decarboxylase